MGTFTPFLSANKKDLISAKMNPRALRSNVTSSALGGWVPPQGDSGSSDSIGGWGDTEQLLAQRRHIERTGVGDCWAVDTKAKDDGNIL